MTCRTRNGRHPDGDAPKEMVPLALKKLAPTNYGVNGEYWRIAQTNIDWTTMNAHVEVLQYVDEGTRKGGSTPVGSISLDLDLNLMLGLKMPVESVMDIGSVIYTIVKASHPFFSDAEDVLDAGQVKVELDLTPT